MIFKLEGLEETYKGLGELTRITERNTGRRVLLKAAEPTAELAARLAPEDRGILTFSVAISTKLTSRHRDEKEDEIEVYIGPAGGLGALFYASHVEFGTVDTRAQPYLRPAWEATKTQVLGLVISGLKIEVEQAAARARRKSARLAGA